MNKFIRKEIPMGSKTLVLETGKIARQASASVIASMGNTVVMCAVVTKTDDEKRDFKKSLPNNWIQIIFRRHISNRRIYE